MSDAFSLGITSEMQSDQKRDQQALVYAQIYSGLLAQSAAAHTAQVQGYYALQSAIEKIRGDIQVAKIKDTGENARAQLTASTEMNKTYLTQLNDNYRKEIELKNTIAKTILEKNMERETEFGKAQIKGKFDIATHYIQAESAANVAMIQGKSHVFEKMLTDGGYDPASAKLIAEEYSSTLPASYGILNRIGESPKAKLARIKTAGEISKTQKEIQQIDLNMQLNVAKEKREWWQAQSQYAPPEYDAKGNLISEGGLEYQKLAAMKNQNTIHAIGVANEGLKNFIPMVRDMENQIMSTAGVDKDHEARVIAQLDELNKAAQHGADPQKVQAATAQLLATSKIPLETWHTYLGVKAARDYNISRSAGLFGLAFNNMPTQQMIEDFHNKMPVDTRNGVEKIGAWVWNTLVPGGIKQQVFEKPWQAAANMTTGADIDLDASLMNAQNFALRKQKVKPNEINARMEQLSLNLSKMSPAEKIAALQELAAQDPANTSAAQIRDFHRSVGQVTNDLFFGDTFKNGGGPLDGHYGLVGDAASLFVAGKILGVTAPLWKPVVGFGARMTGLAAITTRIEQAAVNNAIAVEAGSINPLFAIAGKGKIGPFGALGKITTDKAAVDAFNASLTPTQVFDNSLGRAKGLSKIGANPENVFRARQNVQIENVNKYTVKAKNPQLTEQQKLIERMRGGAPVGGVETTKVPVFETPQTILPDEAHPGFPGTSEYNPQTYSGNVFPQVPGTGFTMPTNYTMNRVIEGPNFNNPVMYNRGTGVGPLGPIPNVGPRFDPLNPVPTGFTTPPNVMQPDYYETVNSLRGLFNLQSQPFWKPTQVLEGPNFAVPTMFDMLRGKRPLQR